jgi:hypothetical protein
VKAERFEGHVQVLILVLVAGMAGAASFTHVHDWTMRNTPPGTPSWFGWANAVITELVPAAAGIETRRRKRQHHPASYPMAILVADAVISIAVQLSNAIHTLAGGVAFALPALAFLALTKLVLSRSGHVSEKEDPECAQPAPDPGAQTQFSASPPAENSARATAMSSTSPTPLPLADSASSPDASALTAFPSDGNPQLVPGAQLLASARMTAFAHRQQTGQPITADELGKRLGVPPALAESLLDRIDGTPPSVTAVNGTSLTGGSRP